MKRFNQKAPRPSRSFLHCSSGGMRNVARIFNTAQTDEGEPTSDRNLNTHYAKKRQFRSNRAESERTVLNSFRRSSPLYPDSWLLLVAASPPSAFSRYLRHWA